MSEPQLAVPFVRYDNTTGRIIETGLMQPVCLAHLADTEGWAYLEGVGGNPAIEYVVSGTSVATRPAFLAGDTYTITSDGSQEVSIPFPVVGTATVDGVDYAVTDGTFTFTSDTPGTYVIRLAAFPYIPKTITVTAHAP